MAAKRTTSTDPDKADQGNPADQEDGTPTSEISDASPEKDESSETSEEVVEAEEPAENIDDVSEDLAEAFESDDDGSPAKDDLEPIDDDDAESDLVPDDGEDQIDDDVTVEDVVEPTPEPQEKIVERVVEKRSVFVPAIFGGVFAGLVGLAIGASDSFSALLPESLQRGGAEISAEEVAALRDQIADLEDRIQEPAPAPDLSAIQAEIADTLAAQSDILTAADTALAQRVEELASALTALAEAPVEASLSEEAVAAYERELAAVQDALAQQRAEVETMIAEAAAMEAEADESARLAQAQAAATRLFAALDTGGAFADEVTELQGLGVSVPDPLVSASDGLVSLGTLQSEFPELARSALSAARDAGGGVGGFSGFLQRQLGARSVTPRDGDDPDAILSRAEAALAQGDLPTVLAEIETLPDVAKAPLAGWSASAAARQAALGAADDLAQSLASN